MMDDDIGDAEWSEAGRLPGYNVIAFIVDCAVAAALLWLPLRFWGWL